jgi:hypothetical protein
LRRLQHRLELARIAALDKKAVRIVTLGQRDQTSRDASFPEPSREVLRRVLAAAVAVGIKGYIELVPSSAFFATLSLCYTKYFLVVQGSPACARIDG